MSSMELRRFTRDEILSMDVRELDSLDRFERHQLQADVSRLTWGETLTGNRVAANQIRMLTDRMREMQQADEEDDRLADALESGELGWG